MAGEKDQRHSGDPLQSGDAYKKKNFNRMVMMIFGLAVLLLAAYVAVAHLYFAKPNSQDKVRSAPGVFLLR